MGHSVYWYMITKQLRNLVGLVTEQIVLSTNPLCPACGEEEETSYQLLGKCCASMVTRYSILGAHTMGPDELGEVRPTTLL